MDSIRIAKPSDAPDFLQIYGPFVTDTAVTFETEIPSLSVMEERISLYLEKWPWLVFESGGKVAGYAYATHHRERAAYQWCVESSIYLDAQFRGKGIAAGLYKTLFGILQHQGFVNVYAGITLPNTASVEFHKKSGFEWIGDYRNIGYKMDKWHTVSWWQLALNAWPSAPATPTGFKDLDAAWVLARLKDFLPY